MARRRARNLNVFTAAGLLNFKMEGEIEKIKLSPKSLVIGSILVMAVVIVLTLLRI